MNQELSCCEDVCQAAWPKLDSLEEAKSCRMSGDQLNEGYQSCLYKCQSQEAAQRFCGTKENQGSWRVEVREDRERPWGRS